ncbi:MAG: AI-2E family transporter [Deltaproteobacteria bacterium]|nr:AI-2E family transporter [Deltaproteobacteria bacterium]
MTETEDRAKDGAVRFRHGLEVAALSMLLLVLLTIALKELASILQPLFIGVFLGYLILPAHKWLTRHKIPSALSYLLIALLVVSVMWGVGTMLVNSIAALLVKLPVYEKKMDALLVTTIHALPLEFPGFEVQRIREIPFLEFLSLENLADTGITTLKKFTGFFTTMLVILVYLIFLIAEGATFRKRVKNSFGEGKASRIMDVVGTINKAIAQYIAVKTLISFIIAAISTAILGGFGVDFFILWGIITFFANFIPYIGSMAAVTPPILLAFLQFDHPWKGIVIAALLIGAQLVTGQIIEPRLAGRKLGVSPLMILLSLAFWGWLWGVIGMILAVPTVVIIKIVLDNIEQTKPVAGLLSDI